jgi:hypothetical protein
MRRKKISLLKRRRLPLKKCKQVCRLKLKSMKRKQRSIRNNAKN